MSKQLNIFDEYKTKTNDGAQKNEYHAMFLDQYEKELIKLLENAKNKLDLKINLSNKVNI